MVVPLILMPDPAVRVTVPVEPWNESTPDNLDIKKARLLSGFFYA